MSDLCVDCSERPVEHPWVGVCKRCYQRRWRLAHPGRMEFLCKRWRAANPQYR
jgi:hypothetical protein